MPPAMKPMTTRVDRAFFHAGSLKAGTPLEMASTPVTAAPPEANALSTMKSAGAVANSAVVTPSCRTAMRALAGTTVPRRAGGELVEPADEPSATMLSMKK